MIHWPQRATRALVRLFAPLQEIDVYVEDRESEVFYQTLLEISVPDVRVVRVFALNGREDVLAAAAAYRDARRALFIIDGDFSWVRDEPAPSHNTLYRLEAYCIENLLLSETSAADVLSRFMAIAPTEAANLLKFDEWRQRMSESLVPLFALYAILNVDVPDHATISRGVGRLVSKSGRKTVLDPTRVAHEISEVKRALVGAGLSIENIDKRQHAIIDRTRFAAHAVDIVSGKDFLLALLEWEMRLHCNQVPARKALCFNLARACNPERLRGLAEAVRAIARTGSL